MHFRAPVLGALGTLVWDRISHPTGEGVLEQWGGAVYSLSALSASCPAGWTVFPIVKIGADRASAALARIGSLPNLLIGPGVRTVAEATNQVELRYQNSADRHEILTGGVPPWTWDELEPILGPFSALYINFISGFEMELETAERIRHAFGGTIYADLHSLFLGPPGDGPRAPRPLPGWQRWLRCFDVIQLNEVELSLLTGREEADPEQLLGLGPSLVLVTLGERGARFAGRRPEHGARNDGRRVPPDEPVVCGFVPPPEGPLAGDPTGCGDVWGSVVCTGLLEGLPVPAAIQRAHRCAAAKIQTPSTDTLHLALRAAITG